MRFFLIDRITSWQPGRAAEAVKNVALSEDFFDDHFPLKPILPGVLILEGMAQLSGLLLEEGLRQQAGRKLKALMSIVEKAKFRIPVKPGESLRYRAQVLSVNELGGRVSAEATADGALVAECTLIFSFHEFDNPVAEARRAELLSMWLGEPNTHGS